LTDYQSQDTLN